MSRLTRAIVHGLAGGLFAVVGAVIIIGLMTNWENLRRPTFIREELAWFGVCTILDGLNTWYTTKGIPGPT
jgi:hypothetical protein